MNQEPVSFNIEIPPLVFPDQSQMYESSQWEGVFELEYADVDGQLQNWMSTVSEKVHDKLKTISDGAYDVVDGKLLLYRGGKPTPLHTDGIDFAHGMIEYSCVLFLNKPESGGELIFPDTGHTFEPEAGKLVIFLNGLMNPHYVAAYTGERKVFIPYIALA